jgi:predicted alpha/beta-fold hydrolase
MTPEQPNKKLILIVPGVTGCSADMNIQEFATMSIERGYSIAILNHFVPKYESSSNIRLLDFGDSETMHEIYNFLKGHFENCDEIFGIGYSLGGCYVLRSVGAPNA